MGSLSIALVTAALFVAPAAFAQTNSDGAPSGQAGGAGAGSTSPAPPGSNVAPAGSGAQEGATGTNASTRKNEERKPGANPNAPAQSPAR